MRRHTATPDKLGHACVIFQQRINAQYFVLAKARGIGATHQQRAPIQTRQADRFALMANDRIGHAGRLGEGDRGCFRH